MTGAGRLRLLGALACLVAATLVVSVTVVSEPSAPVTLLTDVLRWVFGPRISPVVAERIVAAAANIGLFVPLGAGGALIAGRHRGWLVLTVCGALSAGVELVQGLWLPRDAQVSDVVLNTVGAGLGCALVMALQAAARGARSASSGRSPRPR